MSGPCDPFDAIRVEVLDIENRIWNSTASADDKAALSECVQKLVSTVASAMGNHLTDERNKR